MSGHRKFSELRRKTRRGYESSDRPASDLDPPPPGPAPGAPRQADLVRLRDPAPGENLHRSPTLPEPRQVYAFSRWEDAADVATGLRLRGFDADWKDAGWGTGEYVVVLRLNEALATALGLDLEP